MYLKVCQFALSWLDMIGMTMDLIAIEVAGVFFEGRGGNQHHLLSEVVGSL